MLAAVLTACAVGTSPGDLSNAIVLAPDDKKKPLFFFSHISKVGGRSFVQDAKSLLKIDPCGPYKMGRGRDLKQWQHTLATRAVPLFRAGLCQFFTCEGPRSQLLEIIQPAVEKANAVYELVLLREPTAHMASMYMHCQIGTGMKRHGYVPIGFAEWLRADPQQALRSCAYERQDYQTRMLGGSSDNQEDGAPTVAALGRARETVNTARFVGILEHYGLSLCVLSAKFGPLPVACNCSGWDGNSTIDDSLGASSVKTHWVRHSTQPEELHLTGADLGVIRDLTARDQVLYSQGVLRFQNEVNALNLGCWLDSPDASQTLLRRLSLTHRLSLHFNEEGVDEDPEGFED